MITEETFYRRDEIVREAHTLPAATYNLAHTLLSRAQNGCLFVPIRSMQFLAVLDGEEIIFVDREGGRFIEIAWQAFRPQDRAALTDPVSYEVVYYSPQAAALMARLHGEFIKALHLLESRTAIDSLARVIKLDRTGA
jgi:hypothetical protein